MRHPEKIRQEQTDIDARAQEWLKTFNGKDGFFKWKCKRAAAGRVNSSRFRIAEACSQGGSAGGGVKRRRRSDWTSASVRGGAPVCEVARAQALAWACPYPDTACTRQHSAQPPGACPRQPQALQTAPRTRQESSSTSRSSSP